MKNHLHNFCAFMLFATSILMSGCASYEKFSENVNGKMADMYTSVRDGEKTITVEDSPNAKKLKLNLKYRLPTGDDIFGPRLTGDLVYKDSCKRFSFQALLKNGEDVQISVRTIYLGEYEGGTKRMFDQHVQKEDARLDSDKVKTILVKNIRCEN